MTSRQAAPMPTVIPTLRYRDAHAALDWLCRAFGFERHLVAEAEDGGVQHAQLTFGHGMIMLGQAGESSHDSMMAPPAEIGGRQTQSAYLIVADVDAHHARAAAAGAEIVLAPEDQPYGGRLYSARDPEGHLWNFGSYDPWASEA